VLEELAFLGALENKLAIGTMNRGGIIGASWEIDDRLTSYNTEYVESMGLDGGKTLIRIDLNDPNTAPTLELVAKLTSELASRKIMAMIEPLPYTKNASGKAVLDTSDEALINVVAVASGLGISSAYSWLKIPTTSRMKEVAAATTLPILMLGGEPGADANKTFDAWKLGLEEPNVKGLVAGRSLLYPKDGDSLAAVKKAAELVRKN
jgi:tagatose-1,6-bisphosphate aldolase